MTRLFSGALLLIGLIAQATTGLAQTAAQPSEPRLKVRLKPPRAEIGDPVTAELELTVPQGLAIGEPVFPTWSETWGELEVVAVGATVSEFAPDGASRYRQTLVLRPWRTGEIPLPAATVELPTAREILPLTSRDPAVLTVLSVLPEGETEPGLKPPAPPRPLPVSERFWWTSGAMAGLCLLAAILLALRRRAARHSAEPTPVEPLDALRAALDELARLDEPTALVAALSLELRRYLGRRLAFHAAESTTTEIRRRLQTDGLPAGLVRGIDRLLRQCDAIKFARRPTDRATCTAALAEAAGLAGAVEDHVRPPETEMERAAA